MRAESSSEHHEHQLDCAGTGQNAAASIMSISSSVLYEDRNQPLAS